MEEEFLIRSEKDYQEEMAVIYNLMNKGGKNFTLTESEWVRKMALATEKYEDKHYQIFKK